MKAASVILIMLISVGLAGCGLEQVAAQQQEKQYQAALADCNARIPTVNRTNVVAKMQCTNNAIALALPELGSNSDLLQTYLAYRASVAEQIQDGRITGAQGAALITQRWSEVVSEAQRRNAAGSEAFSDALVNALVVANATYAAAPPPNLGTHCTTNYFGRTAYTNCY